MSGVMPGLEKTRTAKMAWMAAVAWALASTALSQGLGAEIELRQRAIPKGEVVRLGDVARISAGDRATTAEFEAIELFTAPPTGGKRFVRLREIQDAMTARGVNLAQHTFSGASLVSVEVAVREAPRKAPAERKPSSSDESRLKRRVRDAVLQYLRDQADRPLGWELSFDLSEDQLRSLLAARSDLSVTGGERPWTGDQEFVVTADGPTEQIQITLLIQVSAPPAVVVAARTLSRGMRIGEADVRLMPAPVPVADALYSLDQVIGREATQTLTADQPITPDDIRTPLLVRRGEVVTVFARSQGIRVRTTARARDDGSAGELVTVESLAKDRKSFFARVCGLQEVEIYARAVSAVEPGGVTNDTPQVEPASMTVRPRSAR